MGFGFGYQGGGYPPRPEAGYGVPKPPDLAVRGNWPGWLMTGQIKLMPPQMHDWHPVDKGVDLEWKKTDAVGAHLIDLEFIPGWEELLTALWHGEFFETLVEIGSQRTVDLTRTLTTVRELEGEAARIIRVGGDELIEVVPKYAMPRAKQTAVSKWSVGMSATGDIVKLRVEHALKLEHVLGSWTWGEDKKPDIKLTEGVIVERGERPNIAFSMMSGSLGHGGLEPYHIKLEAGGQRSIKVSGIELDAGQVSQMWPRVTAWAADNFMLDAPMGVDVNQWTAQIHRLMQAEMSR